MVIRIKKLLRILNVLTFKEENIYNYILNSCNRNVYNAYDRKCISNLFPLKYIS